MCICTSPTSSGRPHSTTERSASIKWCGTIRARFFLGAGGYLHHLGLNTWAGSGAPRPTEADARLLEWRMVLPSTSDVQQAAASLASAGNDVTADGDDCLAADPWGTRVRLMSHESGSRGGSV